MDAEDHKRRVAAILEDAPWERSKTVQKKAERELRAIARKERNKGKPPTRPREWHEQRDVCIWLTKNGFSFFAPSAEVGGEDVDPVRMSQFHSIGFRSGIPDLILVDLAKDGRPIALEMKRTKLHEEKSLSDKQKKWKVIFLKKKWHHLVGIGANDAIAKLKQLLN